MSEFQSKLSKEMFEKITGANKDYFIYQQTAIRNLKLIGVPVKIAFLFLKCFAQERRECDI